VRKHVDKAGSDGKAGCINDGFGVLTPEVTDGNNPITANADVGSAR
jgi:hypothetical protein